MIFGRIKKILRSETHIQALAEIEQIQTDEFTAFIKQDQKPATANLIMKMRSLVNIKYVS